MNAVEIEEAVSALSEAPFDRADFPFRFLQAFGNSETTLKRLRKGESNKSDVPGGVLQTKHIHLLATAPGEVGAGLAALKASPATLRAKARFVLATDGELLEAEELASGETVICDFRDLPNKFGFLLPLAGISTVKQVKESAFDIRATGRLNKLYVELLRDNPDWAAADRRPAMNHFLARLIFCFFAEDTGIFFGEGRFTATVEQFSDATNVHQVISEMFRAMDTPFADRVTAGLRGWANEFPYVNGALFSGDISVPRFSRVARSYLVHIGNLDWTRINPDIFGSMIQAVADDEERGALGMHYTSVPNILKVLDPLFLDELREKLADAGENGRKLLNLRTRLARIRVFDPACGSGNFLVIAYKAMRAIEAEINRRRGETGRRSEIPLTNFRGIEIRDFPAEIARLALIIAEYQCDVLNCGQREALEAFLPLDQENWIVCGNALRLDWLSVCPPVGMGVRVRGEDLFGVPLERQAEIDFEHEGGETYICGNPPYQGSVNQTIQQKEEMNSILKPRLQSYKDLDYVSAWFIKSSEFINKNKGSFALVSTNSICQGEQVAMLWPYIFSLKLDIIFAHRSFAWANSAANNAGVTCVVIGVGRNPECYIFEGGVKRLVKKVSPYLVEGSPQVVLKRSDPLSMLPKMVTGNLPSDGGNLLISDSEYRRYIQSNSSLKSYFKRFVGSKEIINGGDRWCVWIDEVTEKDASKFTELKLRFDKVREFRSLSRGIQGRGGIDKPWRFVFSPHRDGMSIAVPKVFSSRREFITCALFDDNTVVSDLARVIYSSNHTAFAIISSKLHLAWIGAVCGRLKTDHRYSNTLGWNTFPVPTLTNQDNAELERCGGDILLAREAFFPATLSELYDPDTMPDDLRAAHDRNDETLERIYIGRRFRNDTERLEVLFKMYAEMVANEKTPAGSRKGKRA
ncbi:MAG: class I SAM-dependent DNA methyltransferase [Janthinobacterium lividum]